MRDSRSLAWTSGVAPGAWVIAPGGDEDRPAVVDADSIRSDERRDWVGRRVVLVPVGVFDRRAALATRHAGLVAADERRAMHVAIDAAAARQVGLGWMKLQPHGVVLEIVEPIGDVAATVAAEVRSLVDAGASEVVVVIGQLSMRGLHRGLLHDGTAAAISDAVNEVPGAFSVLLAVPVDR